MVARGFVPWQSTPMAIPPSRKPRSRTPMSGGFLLAASLVVGSFVGASRGEASIGFVAGLGVGLALLAAVWLIDRRRTR